MGISSLGRCALGLCVTAAMLAGCGGSQQRIGATGAMPQTSAIAAHADRGKSWMLPGTSSGDLLYATGGCGGTCVLSYPGGKVVGALDVGEYGVCSDASGNVFLTANDAVVEYAHGGTAPIATFNLPGNTAIGCSIDATTNDLAVVFTGDNGDVAIFPNGSGPPTLYWSGFGVSSYCGYDNAGNLLVDGYNGDNPGLAELTSGGSSFMQLSVSTKIGTPPGQVQWDGKFMTYQTLGNDPRVSRLRISGSEASIIHTSRFRGIHRSSEQSWIYGGRIFIPYSQQRFQARRLSVWDYPTGGKLVQTFDFGNYQKTLQFQGVALSVAPPKTPRR